MATTEVVFALPEEVVSPLLQGAQFRITSCEQFFEKGTSKYMNLSKQKQNICRHKWHVEVIVSYP